jgi:ATP-dependent RNA helicase DeaD
MIRLPFANDWRARRISLWCHSRHLVCMEFRTNMSFLTTISTPGARSFGPQFSTELSGGAAVLDRPETDEDTVMTTTEAVPATAQAEPAVDAEAVAEVEDAGVTFADLGLSPLLLESVTAVGFKKPTPIQEQTIPVLLNGQDVIAQAQTGSGKTAAFGLPIIESIDPSDRHVQALVLCPTRELAIQVSEALTLYGRHKRIETLPIYGGQPYERQFRGLQRGVHIVVGTPGRVMDHMRRNTLHLNNLKFFILDEADEMLDMGFVDDIEWILKEVPEERQTALFSATMPPRIADLANKYMHDAQRISVRGKHMTVAEVNQTSYEFPRGRKVEALARILEAETPTSAIIFCRTKHGVDELGESLMTRGFAVETLHGDLSQSQRDRVMKRFRAGQAQILIATDVAARGLDIDDVSHVINYDAPESAETYVHRIGRTGRAGKTGEAITLVTPREFRWLRQVERITRATIEPRRLPSQSDVNDRRREKLKALLRREVEKEETYEAYLAPVTELAEEFDASKLAAAVLKLYAEETGRATTEDRHDELANFGGYGQRNGAGAGAPGGAPRQRGGGGGEAGMTRLFVNIGRNMHVRPQDFVGAIANEANIPGRAIGAIDILDTYSFVDVPTDAAPRVIEAMNNASIKGRPFNVEISTEPAGGTRQRGPRRDGPRSGGFRGDRGGFGARRDEEARGGRGGFNRGPRPEGDRRTGGPRRDRY